MGIRINKLQLEQDSGKTADRNRDNSFVDLNRCGVPVLEIVTAPDLKSSDDVECFLKKLQKLLAYNGICDEDQDESATRCDVNISVGSLTSPGLNRVELKHLSKISLIKAAINFEIQRQITELECGKSVFQETRGVNPQSGETFKMRRKEDIQDYSIGERLKANYSLNKYEVKVLLENHYSIPFYEKVRSWISISKNSRVVTNLFGWLKMRNITFRDCPITSDTFGELIDLISQKTVSALRAKDILTSLLDGDKGTPLQIAERNNWIQNQDNEAISIEVDRLLAAHPSLVEKIRQGKNKLLKFFSGELMKQSRGTFDPILVDKMLREKVYGSELSGKQNKQ
ncbi:hypothetical protein HDU67_003029 [Dinochytrium kinnereticum]|nr:hypothetical protein HDU67_003029 [Dinochytrium kinnereticum]